MQSTYEFNDIQKHLDNIHELTQKIEATDNAKAATDLNSRLIAELAYVSVQELKMLTLLNEQTSQQSAGNIAAMSQQAAFNKLDE